MTLHALTIDLEDWHQLMYRRAGREVHPSKNVVCDTERLLDFLDQAGTLATFFVLGYVADAYPHLVREIDRRGHEIGSHSSAHLLVHEMNPDTFKKDVESSRKQLQDLTGQQVLGFRAPEFSVGSLNHWCFDVLAEVGFRYDSSVFPWAAARYGIADAPREPFPVDTPGGVLWEFPLATWQLGGRRLPIAGGTYFRLLPAFVLSRGLADLDSCGRAAVLYFHPYEFHSGWLYLSNLSWSERLNAEYLKFLQRHNFLTSRIALRLRPLLEQFTFAPLGQLYSRLATSNPE